MRLRLVVPPDVDEPTGGNVYDLALAAALRREGHQVQTLRCEPDALASSLQGPWAGHTLVDGLLACHRPAAVASASAAVAVLVHMPLALETGLALDRADRVDERERDALHAASTVVATSHWCAEYLAQHHGLVGVAVAPPGTLPAPVSRGSQPPLFVHLAALMPHKDQLGVVAALDRVRDLSWQARLAGPLDRDPLYTATVRDAVRTADLTDRVEIPGVLDREAAWAGADMALLPSLVETFGMVVSEALARGIPAIVSEDGPAEALGVTTTGERPGVVVPAGDTEALALALRRWLTDAEYRERLRGLARARRSTLSGWDTTAHLVRAALTRPS